jgi:hypothetical protein
MALNDLSFSGPGRGAVLSDSVRVYALSGSVNLLFGDGSRGLCSSRIDFVLDNKLNGFGFPFLMTFVFEKEGGGSVWESRETSDLAGPATGRWFVDRSLLDSIHPSFKVSSRYQKRRNEIAKVVLVLLVSFDETFPAMAGRSVSLDMLSSVTGRADSEFCRRLELFAAL